LLARNPAENFGRDWSVVDMAVDRGAIRHDLFPKRSGLSAKARIKGAIGWGYSQLDQRTLFLSTLSQRPPVWARAIYVIPADALSSGSISGLRAERLCVISAAPGSQRSHADGRVVVPSYPENSGSIRAFFPPPARAAVPNRSATLFVPVTCW
jgi:hypothetical protein